VVSEYAYGTRPITPKIRVSSWIISPWMGALVGMMASSFGTGTNSILVALIFAGTAALAMIAWPPVNTRMVTRTCPKCGEVSDTGELMGPFGKP
jgi:hypothetical protein